MITLTHLHRSGINPAFSCKCCRTLEIIEKEKHWYEIAYTFSASLYGKIAPSLYGKISKTEPSTPLPPTPTPTTTTTTFIKGGGSNYVGATF